MTEAEFRRRAEAKARREPRDRTPISTSTAHPERATVVLVGEVEFALHRDGTLGNPRIFTSSLSPEFDDALLRMVAGLDSLRTTPPLPETVHSDSLVLVFTARNIRDSSVAQDPMFHATLPVWMVDHAVRARRRNPAPSYPPNAERARIGDSVLYSFVVDQDGVPRVETLRLLGGKYLDFQRAVLAVLPRWRFEPATIGGCPVMQRVQMSFGFRTSF